MTYGDLKDSNRRTAADKVLHVMKYLISLKIQIVMGINVDLLKWFINFLIKKNMLAVL